MPIGIDHTATAGLTSPKTIGAASVSATLNTTGGSNGFSRQTPFRFDVALPNVITVVVDNLTVMPGGMVHVTAHFTRLVGQVTANTVAVFSATDAKGDSVGGLPERHRGAAGRERHRQHRERGLPAGSERRGRAGHDFRRHRSTVGGRLDGHHDRQARHLRSLNRIIA